MVFKVEHMPEAVRKQAAVAFRGREKCQDQGFGGLWRVIKFQVWLYSGSQMTSPMRRLWRHMTGHYTSVNILDGEDCRGLWMDVEGG